MRHLRLYIAIATALMVVPVAASANTITIGLTGGTAGVSGSTVTTTSLSSWASYDFVTPTTDSGLQTPTTPETSFGTFSFTTGDLSVASNTSANFAAGGSLQLNTTDFPDLGIIETGTFTGSFTGTGTGSLAANCNGTPMAGNNYEFSQPVTGALDEGLVAPPVFTPVVGTLTIFSCGNTGTPSLASSYPMTEGTLFLTDQIPTTTTPEPGTLSLFGSGLLGIGFWVRRRLAVKS